ncbi:MAG TPA: efflux RND transporter periplasmic adaptor subunit [Bacteroidia bacterium]|nr:efflux RND transporter periplasmic adaptor subunit [Bacteroidia bacterium]
MTLYRCDCLVLIILILISIHIIKTQKLKKESAARAKELKKGLVVKTSIALPSSPVKELILIGEARPYQSTTLYAKISGYLEKIYVDKGDTVTEGEVLAYVDNPEIDQQYKSAVADYDNKKKIAERDQLLLQKKFLAQEEADISQTNADMAEANVKSLEQQQQYKYLKAPFSGIIIARYVDPGALIQNADNSQTSAQPVVSMSDLKKLRIYAYIEQSDAAFLKTGDSVEITLPEKPNIHLKATISRLADELDTHTRMMLGEVDIDNKNNIVVPGSYVQMHIKYSINLNGREVLIPSVALIIHNDSNMVAIIDKDSTLHFRKVKVGVNTGEKVSILDGVNIGDHVALSVGESFKEGQKVRETAGQQVSLKNAYDNEDTKKKEDKK